MKYSQVCPECNRKMNVKRNGVVAIECYGETLKTAYKIWQADLFACPQCEHEVVAGFGFNPIAQNGSDNFDDVLKDVRERNVPGVTLFYFW